MGTFFFKVGKASADWGGGGGDDGDGGAVTGLTSDTKQGVGPECVCGPQCEWKSDMQTPGRDFNNLSGHSYSGECRHFIFSSSCFCSDQQ